MSGIASSERDHLPIKLTPAESAPWGDTSCQTSRWPSITSGITY
jgi:hypothetical protein